MAGFQQLEYENTDDNTGDTADTTVYGYTADGAGCDCLQLITLTHVNSWHRRPYAPRRKPAIAYRAAAVT